ncbi:phospholipase D-like domain-containing protein [Cellulomonas edaphi]|uniref:phospholipase D n=1 Tax=Cellulomonas edaphi TaxID=3053468 RepID=A0ABT7S584_9CELL|nr:phospholipase D-like domain-containing protein [Cellulomons edaphi]MDM7830778.1 phospholipase D-like domain-containing protein [Cellulomons edaphi]
MGSRTRGTRAPGVRHVVVGGAVALLALVLAFAGVGPAAASTGASGTVIVATRPTVYGPGERVVVGGRVVGAPAGTAVTLQRAVGHAWKTVMRTTTTSRGRFTAAYDASASTARTTLRVRTASTARVKASTSRAFTLRPRASASISARLAGGPFVKGDAVVVTGSLSPARSGVVVRLEALHGSSWGLVTSGRTGARGTYRLATKATSATTVLRVVGRKAGTPDDAVSRAVTATHYTCVPGKAPAGGMAARFNTPNTGSGREISSLLVGAACAAASHSTISVAVYILTPGEAEPARILRALRSVARERDVRVRFVLERSGSGITNATIAQLRQFADVVVCTDACVTRTSTAAQMHNKVFTVSDTRWKSGVDPVVVLGSANWSTRQLHQYWQTAAIFHDDDAMYAAHLATFDLLRTCARTSCDPSRVKATVETDRGRGATLHFFPQATGDESLAAMRSVSCAPGSRIRIAMYQATASRVARVNDELRRLVAQGCDVDVVLSDGGIYYATPAVTQSIRSTGVGLRCATLMHGKFAVYQNVVVDGRGGQTIVTDGSQNWTPSGLRRNDDSTFTLSSAKATGLWKARIASVGDSYERGWQAIASRTHACR